MIRSAITTLLLIGLLGTSGSASARDPSDPECLWRQMKPTTRTGLVRAYAAGGADALGAIPISNVTIASIARSCGMSRSDDVSLRSAATAIAGIALEHAAEERLSAVHVPLSRLQRAWVKAPAAEKRLVLASMSDTAGTDREAARRFFQTVVDLARSAGAPLRAGVSPIEDKTIRPYIDWFLGHAQAEHFWTARPRG